MKTIKLGVDIKKHLSCDSNFKELRLLSISRNRLMLVFGMFISYTYLFIRNSCMQTLDQKMRSRCKICSTVVVRENVQSSIAKKDDETSLQFAMLPTKRGVVMHKKALGP